MLNMTVIPEIFADILNISYEASGILISVVVTMMLLLAFSVLSDSMNMSNSVFVGIGCFTLFTFLGWFNIWVMILIAMVTAVLWAKGIVKVTGGNGNG